MKKITKYRVESAAQLTFFTALAVAVVEYVPVNLMMFYAAFLLVFTVHGCGWPFSPPCGKRIGSTWSSLSMTFIPLLPALCLELFTGILLPGKSLQVGLLTLWLVFIWGLGFSGWPLIHEKPGKSVFVALASVSLAALVLASALEINTGELLRFSLHTTAFIATFSQPFMFQGYPFVSLWRQPRIGLATVATAILFAAFTHPFTVDLFTTVLSSSIVLWSILFSWAFAYPGTLKNRQPKRGIYSAPIVLVLSALWAYMFSMFLAADKIVTMNLSLILPAFLVHNLFWIRKPLSPPLLIGMPPPGQVDEENLFEWVLQLRRKT